MFQVKLFRIKKGLSQAELSEILGCDQANISRMENNRIPMAQIYVDILKTKYGEEISEYISDGKPSKLLGAFGWKSKGEEGYEEIRNKLVELLEVIRVKTGLSAEDVSQKLYRRRKAIPNALYGDVISPDTTVFILKNAKKLGLTASELMLPNSSANSKGENKKGQILKKRILKKYNHMETKKKIIQEIEDAVDIDLSPKVSQFVDQLQEAYELTDFEAISLCLKIEQNELLKQYILLTIKSSEQPI